MSLHMGFSGSPGTGKTMIARLMGRFTARVGILSKGQLIEVDRSGLVAGYVGQTAIKTGEVIERPLARTVHRRGISLTSGGENDFGAEALTHLRPWRTPRDLVVIVAGYTDLMEGFISSNPD
jgi:predicted ATPase with chaperone activity